MQQQLFSNRYYSCIFAFLWARAPRGCACTCRPLSTSRGQSSFFLAAKTPRSPRASRAPRRRSCRDSRMRCMGSSWFSLQWWQKLWKAFMTWRLLLSPPRPSSIYLSSVCVPPTCGHRSTWKRRPLFGNPTWIQDISNWYIYLALKLLLILLLCCYCF